MLTSILSALGALAPFVGLLVSFWKASQAHQQQQQGAALEAAKVDRVTATAEMAIAQADAGAPTDQMALVDRLKAGAA